MLTWSFRFDFSGSHLILSIGTQPAILQPPTPSSRPEQADELFVKRTNRRSKCASALQTRLIERRRHHFTRDTLIYPSPRVTVPFSQLFSNRLTLYAESNG